MGLLVCDWASHDFTHECGNHVLHIPGAANAKEDVEERLDMHDAK